MVAGILDNFNFDLSPVTSVDGEDDDGLSGDVQDSTAAASEDVAMEEGENPGEIHVGDDIISKEEETEAASCDDHVTVESMSCDNEPQKKKLAEKIYRTILNSILPGLQSVLTKKVRNM